MLISEMQSEFFPYEDATLKQVMPKTFDEKKAVEKQTLVPKKKSQPKILQDEREGLGSSGCGIESGWWRKQFCWISRRVR